MTKLPFRQRLHQPTPLLADGAMGTQLHKAGAAFTACFEALNLNAPAMVQAVHRDYLLAGADLIETNTFGANRLKLSAHGLGDQVAAVNAAAVQIVQHAMDATQRHDAYIAGSIGPTGETLRPYGRLSSDEARATFHEQVTALREAGVDLLLFETFADHRELLEALHAARDAAPDLPVVCQATFSREGQTLTGYSPAKVAADLYAAGADVIGVNCSAGPAQIAELLQGMADSVPDLPLSVMPNAGYPETVNGRVMYPATAAYFGEYALIFQHSGAQIIGGCCGTTPEHVAAMRQALDAAPAPSLPRVEVLDATPDLLPDATPDAGPHTELARRLAAEQFTVTVELAPPRGFSAEALLHNARLLRDAGAHVLDVADTPAARMRMSPWAVAHLIQDRVGIDTVLHFPTRGRNLLRVQGDLLAAHALGLRNLFITMGDPTRIGDYPDASDSYDIVPSKLIEVVKQRMNAGQDQAGNSIGGPTAFTVGAALNMFADDIDREIKVLGKKLAAGADFALGQAVFEPHKIEGFLRRYEQIEGQPLRLPVLMGIMPLYSLRHALFLHNEVPGIHIPDSILARIESAGDDAPAEGVRIAQELLTQVRGLVAGAYVIPSFGKYHLAAEVVDSLRIPG